MMFVAWAVSLYQKSAAMSLPGLFSAQENEIEPGVKIKPVGIGNPRSVWVRTATGLVLEDGYT